MKRKYIPPLSLQELVENAQKHSNIDKGNPLKLNIFCENGEYIVIRNNINNPKPVNKITKTGLSNLISRYKFLSNKEIVISVTNNTFTVKLPLIEIENQK